jgi:hypothetical protein
MDYKVMDGCCFKYIDLELLFSKILEMRCKAVQDLIDYDNFAH